MNSEGDINEPGDIADEGVRDKVTNDARLQYHKLWLWHEGKIRQYMLLGDRDGWFRLVKGLHVFASAFFDKKDNDAILLACKTVDSKMELVESFNYRNAAFTQEKRKIIREVEDDLLRLEEMILRFMKNKNMLLPVSNDDELEEDALDSMFD